LAEQLNCTGIRFLDGRPENRSNDDYPNKSILSEEKQTAAAG